MTLIMLSAAVFITMLLFPIAISLFFMRKDGGEVLEIQQSKIRDPRYFVKSFTGLFEKKWKDYDGSGKLALSREEDVLEADGLEEYPPVCTGIVFADNRDFQPPAGVSFEKEVYARQNAYFHGVEMVRAACSKKDLVLGSGTQVMRWVDAERTLTVHDNCDLGISGTSATKIIIGRNCRFRRLYSPVIRFGQAPGEQHPEHRLDINLGNTLSGVIRNIRYVDDGVTDQDGVLTGSVITGHDLTVIEGFTVKGHIRSHKGIRLCDNAAVYGNLFAEGNIYLGQNARVFGSIFTQEGLIAERGVTIGQYGKTKSVIARGKVIFDKNCCVYGYVSSETGGECCPDNSLGLTASAERPFFSLVRLRESFLLKKPWSAVTTAAVLFAIIATGLFATAAVKQAQEKEKIAEEKPLAARALAYGRDGKPDGGQLETEPTRVTEDHIYFEDRVLRLFHYDDKQIAGNTEALAGIMGSLPKGVKKYLMLAPMRISLEGGQYKQYSDDVNRAIDDIYARMPSDVISLDAVGALTEHWEEYLYFRTDEVWTALGAYYAAGEFCKSAGIDMRGIEQYREHRFKPYLGAMRVLPGAESLRRYPDYVSYFTLEDGANEQIITARRAKGEYNTYTAPTVAVSRRGYDIFVGAYFSYSILHGDIKNGRTLMILGDEYSKAFAPWLTPYYENVVLVSVRDFDGSFEKFRELLSAFQVTEFLFMEGAQNLGDRGIIAKIHEVSGSL